MAAQKLSKSLKSKFVRVDINDLKHYRIMHTNNMRRLTLANGCLRELIKRWQAGTPPTLETLQNLQEDLRLVLLYTDMADAFAVVHGQPDKKPEHFAKVSYTLRNQISNRPVSSRIVQ